MKDPVTYYLDKLITDFSRLDSRGVIQVARVIELDLDEVFVDLKSLHKKGEQPKDLVEQIASAVRQIAGDGRKIVFLIDDIDRCHDPAQIVGLLEQIKLFLHLRNCLFFIAADRGQIVKAIETQFPGEGTRYLEKFVQLAIELPQADSRHIVDLLPDNLAAEHRACLLRAAEVLGHNPRKLKALWNRSRICLALMREELQGVTGFSHNPDLWLMVRCLLMQEAGLFQTNPYMVLELETILREVAGTDDDKQLRARFEALLKAGGLPASNVDAASAEADTWRERLGRRLAVHLWQDRDTRFGSPRVLALYLKATGAALPVTRTWMEQQLYDGTGRFAFLALAGEDLSGAHLRGAAFHECDFERADLSNSDVRNTQFSVCRMAGAWFDDCEFTGIQFLGCHGLDRLGTSPETYERLADTLR